MKSLVHFGFSSLNFTLVFFYDYFCSRRLRSLSGFGGHGLFGGASPFSPLGALGGFGLLFGELRRFGFGLQALLLFLSDIASQSETNQVWRCIPHGQAPIDIQLDVYFICCLFEGRSGEIYLCCFFRFRFKVSGLG